MTVVFKKPALGDIVCFTLSTGEVRPAIVVRCWDGQASYPPGVVNLQVFLDGRNDSVHKGANISPFGTVTADDCARGLAWFTSVHPSAEPKPGHWHWPPYVPAAAVPAKP